MLAQEGGEFYRSGAQLEGAEHWQIQPKQFGTVGNLALGDHGIHLTLI